MKLLNLVRERRCENWSSIESFLVEDYVKNPEEALRNAVEDFMKSEEGKKAIEYACGDFNWGVVAANITDEFLKPHGLMWFKNDIETVSVNQDEVLFPEIQEDVLNLEE